MKESMSLSSNQIDYKTESIQTAKGDLSEVQSLLKEIYNAKQPPSLKSLR